MHPLKKAARIAGAIYLSLVLIAPFAMLYVPGKLIVRGNAAATADNILAHETMFRLSVSFAQQRKQHVGIADGELRFSVRRGWLPECTEQYRGSYSFSWRRIFDRIR